MTKQEAIETIKLALSQVEWDYPLDYAAAFDIAISAMEKQDFPDTNVGNMISRQAAIDAIKSRKTAEQSSAGIMRNAVVDFCIDIVKKLPSAQPVTAKRIVGKSRDGMTLWYQCDMCNEPVDVQDSFCRGCGRRLIDERSD